MNGGMMADNQGIYAELADIIRSCAPLIAKSTHEHALVSWRGSHMDELTDDEYLAWLQYELDIFANTAENGGDYGNRSVCPGIALFTTPGRETISIAEAVDGQLFAAKCLAPIIQQRFFGDPVRYDKAMRCFERTIESTVAVNLAMFNERVQDEVRSLGRGSLPVMQPIIPDASVFVSTQPEDDQNPADPSDAGLTAREIEVIKLVALGKSNGEIAAELCITQNTVKNHIRHSLERLGYNSRVQLGVYAICKGLVEPPDARAVGA